MACKIYLVNKIITAISCFLGLTALLVCSWTFGSVIYRDSLSKNTDNGEGFNSTDFSTTTLSPETHHQFEFWAHFDEMPEVFEGIIIGCVWLAIIGSLLQVSSSAVVSWSPARRVASRSRYWVALHFVAFILLLATLFTPLAYDRTNKEFHTIITFNEEVKAGVSNDISKYGFAIFFLHDLHAYYILLFIDCFFMFIGMVVISCLLRFDSTSDKFYAEIAHRYG